ncbi:MAG: 2-phospho-L-lactate transferase CofD family protein, partial [Terriglobia bacterium]
HYTASDHVRALHEHAGGKIFDIAVLNASEFSPALRRRYARRRATPVVNDLDAIKSLGVAPVLTRALMEDGVARHNPRRLASAVLRLAHR